MTTSAKLHLLTATLAALLSFPHEAIPQTVTDDLALLPANARGFVSVRVADLWNTPAAKKAVAEARKADPKSEAPAGRLEDEIGLLPREIERISLVCSDEGLVWAVARTAAPYDGRKVLSRLKGATRRDHQGKQYHAGTDRRGREVAVWPAGPRVLVAGPEAAVKRCIALSAEKAAKGLLEPVLARCKEGHDVVVGLDGKRLGEGKGNLLLSWVTPVELAWATADVVGEMVELVMHARAADEKRAAAMLRGAEASVRLAPEFLSTLIDVDVASELSSLVRSAKAERDGREIVSRVHGDATRLLAAAVLVVCGSPARLEEDGVLLQVRGASGLHRVETGVTRRDGYFYPFHRLIHGLTMHAKQLCDDSLRDLPVTYYHPTGPVGQVFRACNTDPTRAFAVLDLGAGTMACYGLPGQVVDFYEGDPELARITFDTDEYFTFVAAARRRGVEVSLVLGEPRAAFAPKGTRQRLQPLRARKGAPMPKREYGRPIPAAFKYRLIVVDTLGPRTTPDGLAARFTREAVKAYFERLEEDGVVLLHISSRYFDLQPVLATIAEHLGLAGYHFDDDEEDAGVGKTRSHWAALTRKPEHFARLLSMPHWLRDDEQLPLLGAAAWPAGGSAAMQMMTGMVHAGLGWADLQARQAHEAEGRTGDPRLVPSGWRPLETTTELRRLQAEGPKQIRELKARAEALRKQLARAAEASRKAWLTARIEAVEEALRQQERQVAGAAKKLRRNADVGLWTDASADLLSVFAR